MLMVTISAIFIALLSLGVVSPSWSAQSQKTIQLVARILPRASLSLDRSQVTFVGHEDQAVIPNLEGPLAIIAKGRGNRANPLSLSVRANSDLEGALGHIPIHQVSWTYQGQGAASQALQRARDQVVALWTTNGVHRGQLQFVLNNQGHLAPGEYSGSVTLTLSSP
jgi:hypothetical protein